LFIFFFFYKGIKLAIKNLQKKLSTKGLVIITTYEGLRIHQDSLTLIEWTAVCLDEGQKIRNPSANITAVCKLIPAFHRLILSGTPIQNSLRYSCLIAVECIDSLFFTEESFGVCLILFIQDD
jgi:hypothetical protein